MKRNRAGNIFKIEIEKSIHCYARLLEFSLFEFFDFFTEDDLAANEIVQLPIFIHRTLYVTVFTQSSWEVIGNELPAKEYLEKIHFFRQDLFDLNKCWLIDFRGFVLREVLPFDCIGLERETVSDFTTIEEVLKDHFNERENQDEELLKLKLPES